MKVYVVTSGEYSSYGIEAVFLDRRKTEIYCAVQNENDKDLYYPFGIEEYDAHDDCVEGNDEKIKYRYHVINPGLGYYNGPIPINERTMEMDLSNALNRHAGEEYFPDEQTIVYLDEPDAEKALQIVRDRYAKWKAEREGLT